jgi:iron(II)-dependent oxidoreductase
MAKKKRKPVRRKPQPAETQVDQSEVHLKPFLGMSPGLYLTILYTLAIVFILFMLLFFKGLRDKGEYLRVTTFPPGASVKVDGRYVGSTPCETLVKQGIRTVTVTKPYFSPFSLEDEFKAPVFATLFVRPRRDLNIDLELTEAAALVRSGVEDFAANPHIPEIIMDTVRGGANYPGDISVFYDYLDYSKYFVTSPLQLHSFLHAFLSLESDMKVATQTGLLSVVEKIVQLNQKYENFPFWLAVVLQEEAAQSIVDTPWFSRLVSEYRSHYDQLKTRAETSGAPAAGGGLSFQGLRFLNIPGGQLLQGDGEDGFATVQIPHPVSVPSFYISETEVSNGIFRSFLNENPDWTLANKTSLEKRGLVDEEYLSGWESGPEQPGWAELPVTNVSFYAAQAFCQWLTSRLPATFDGYSVRLPFESEWEWAARGGLVGADYPTGSPSKADRFYTAGIGGPAPVGGSAANGYGVRDTLGNVWEWCLDWYSPVKYLFSSSIPEHNNFDSIQELPFGAEKVIRGGSWSNEQELIKVSTRGSQPPDWCTPYLGFRVVLSRYIP